MRILAVGNMYPPHHYGGYELSCQDVLRRWRAAGHEIHVLTTNWRVPGVTAPDEPGVVRTLNWYWDDHVLLTPPVRKRMALERHNEAELARVLAGVKPDVVTVWNMGAMSLGLISSLVASGVPLVFAVCDDWPAYAPRLDRWTAFTRRVPLATRITGLPAMPSDLGKAGIFCFVSSATRAAAEAAGYHFPDATVVYSGIDREDFPVLRPAPARWGGRLLVVSRLDPRKGVGAAVHALAALPNARLDVVGSGDAVEGARLDRLAARLGVADRMTRRSLPRADVRSAYLAADALLFTSDWEEPFGLVPVEAMACGTPVVAMPSGGNREFLRDEVNCLVVDKGDEATAGAALARGVNRLAADADLRLRLVEGGSATAGVLTSDRLASELGRWVDYAVDRSLPRPVDRPPPLVEAGLAV
jgi:glycogen(starch) synthase